MNNNPKHKVGDIIKGIKTGYPHLNMVGDTGWMETKDTSKVVARNVTVKIYPDPITHESFTEDIQIVESLDPQEIEPNPDARCAIHGARFPCGGCEELKKQNYPPFW